MTRPPDEVLQSAADELRICTENFNRAFTKARDLGLEVECGTNPAGYIVLESISIRRKF